MRFLLLFLILTSQLLAQGVYRDQYNYLQINFSEPIIVSDLLDINNYTASNSSAQLIEVLGAGVDSSTIGYYGINQEDTACASVGLKFDKLEWGMMYAIEVNNVYDTASNIIHTVKKVAYWSFEDEDPIPVPNHVVITDTGYRPPEPLFIVGAEASKESQAGEGYVAENVFDGDTNTVWTAEPIPHWVAIELNRTGSIQGLNIAFNYWNQPRIYTYDIHTSIGGVLWEPLLLGETSTVTGQWNYHTFIPVETRYIRVTTVGNNQSLWANIREIEIVE